MAAAEIINTWGPIIGGLGGVGSVAAILGVYVDRRRDKELDKRETAKDAGDLAGALNTSARDWIKYVDEKLDETSREFDEFRAKQKIIEAERAAEDAARRVMQIAHREWDKLVQHEVEVATGKKLPDPPPLDLPFKIS